MNRGLSTKLTIVLIGVVLITGCSAGKTVLKDNVPETEGKRITTSNHASMESSKETIAKQQEKQVEQSKPKDTARVTTETQKPSGVSKKYAPDEIINYNKYTNARYGFTIEYPSVFEVKEVAENGDGAEIVNGPAKIKVFGSNNINNKTAEEIYKDELNSYVGKNVTYKIQKDNWFTISWKEENIINYKKSVVGKGSINTFIIAYPEGERAAFDGIAYHISSTFKTPGINETH